MQTVGAGTALNIQVYDAAGNPITSFGGALAVQLYHNGTPYQVMSSAISTDDDNKLAFIMGV